MHRIAVSFVLALGLAACTGSKAPPIRGDYPVARITDRVYIIQGPNELPNKRNQGFSNNPGFVLTNKGVVVIDPGGSVQVGEMVLRKIAEVTREPVIAVFDTHIHGDHWLGNQAIKAAYPKAVIYAQRHMIEQARADGAIWVRRMNDLTDGAVRGTKPVVPDVDVDNDETVRIGDRHFHVYHNDKAHTDTDIMIGVEEEKTMFLGDAAFAERIGRMDDGDFAGNVAALDTALESDAVHFIPGHGPSGGREVATAYQDYLRTVQQTVKKYYDQGLVEEDVEPRVEAAAAKYRAWKDFDAQLRRHVRLAYLQVKAKTF